MPAGATIPLGPLATNAVPLVTGQRNKINVATQQSGVEIAAPAPGGNAPRRWCIKRAPSLQPG